MINKKSKTLNPLVADMIRIRIETNLSRVDTLTKKAMSFHNLCHAICPADSEYGAEIKKLLDQCHVDSETLHHDFIVWHQEMIETINEELIKRKDEEDKEHGKHIQPDQ
jgi:hypothetical protein